MSVDEKSTMPAREQAIDWLAKQGWSNQYLSKDGWKTKCHLADLLEAYAAARLAAPDVNPGKCPTCSSDRWNIPLQVPRSGTVPVGEFTTYTCNDIWHRPSSQPVNQELLEALTQAKTTFFYVKNLAHDAWRDPPNLEAVCKRIESYALMQYDLIEAAIAHAEAPHET